jgi:hypothetical protein
MFVRIKETGAVLADSEFITLHNNVSFPRPLTQKDVEDFGADLVLDGIPPVAAHFQSVVEDGVEQINEQWFTKFKVVDWSQEQIDSYQESKKSSVRSERNQKLSDSDWTQLADSPENKAAWATYRQALRDIPTQAGFPWEVQWPTQPE